MRIKTKRCILRPFEEKDLDRFVNYRNNESWMIYQDFKGYTKEAYRQMIIDDIPSIHGGLQLAIADNDTDELLGDLYLNANDHRCDLGYTIHPDFARKGYIAEAFYGILPYLAEQGITIIYACAHPKNNASLNLLKKLGFKPNGIADNKDLAFIFKL